MKKTVTERITEHDPSIKETINKVISEIKGQKTKKEKIEEQEEEKKISNIAKELMNRHKFLTVYYEKKDKEIIHIFKKGIWKPGGKKIIHKQTENILGEDSTIHKVREVTAKIKRNTAINSQEFNKTPTEIICVKNGILNLKTKKLTEHNPKHYFKKKLNITYDPEKDCPECKKFFKQTLYEEDIPVIQEWFGFQLYKKYFLKKAMILYGPANTGKSVLLDLLTTFVGNDFVSGLSLQDISIGKSFDLASLHNKLSNIHDDLSASGLKNTGHFKMAVGDSYIDAEIKFGARFKFMNYAKHTFACNKIPSNKEASDEAYWIRWIPIALENVVPKERRDPFLISKLTTDDELSGLLNWSLEGLDRLFSNKCFSYGKSGEEIKNIMMRESTPVVAFVNDVVLRCDNNKLLKNDLYNFYRFYCSKNKHGVMSKRKLTNRLKELLPYVRDGSGRDGRYWMNISVNRKFFKEEYEEDDFFTCNAREGNNNSNCLHMFSQDSYTSSSNRLYSHLPKFKKGICSLCSNDTTLAYFDMNDPDHKICEECHERIKNNGVEE